MLPLSMEDLIGPGSTLKIQRNSELIYNQKCFFRRVKKKRKSPRAKNHMKIIAVDGR